MAVNKIVALILHHLTKTLCMNKWCLILSVVSLFFIAACNPSKQISRQVTERNNKGRDVNVQYPKQASPTPDNINMSYDFEQLFTTTQNKNLDSLVRVFEKSNVIPIKLVTLPESQVAGGNFSTNNAALLKEWEGVHGNTDKAMVISMSKGLGKAAIDFGPFVGKLLSRSEADQIINTYFVPALQAAKPYDGVWKGVNELMNTIRKNIK